MAILSIQEDGGGDFTSLAACLADAGTGAGDIINIEGEWDNADTSECTVADANLTIQTNDADSHHIGRPWQAGEKTYRLWTTGSNHTFTVNAAGLTIIGVDFQNTSTGSSDECIRYTPGTASTLTLTDCVIGFASRNSEQDMIYYDQNDATVFVITNCMIYNVYRGVLDLPDPTGGTITNINSCSFHNIGYSNGSTSRSGVLGYAPVSETHYANIFNSFIYMANAGYSVVTTDAAGTVNVSIDRCISNITNDTYWALPDANLTDGDNIEAASWAEAGGSSAVIVVEKDTSPYDLRLVDDADNIAQDAHSDSGMGGEVGGQTLEVPEYDIIGTERNEPFCIGAYELEGEVTTPAPTTPAPTTLAPTTQAPTTLAPTTLAPTTLPPTTLAPTTQEPTTPAPTTPVPTTLPPTTIAPTTPQPTTPAPTTGAPTTLPPTTLAPTTLAPTTPVPTTPAPTTPVPTTLAPTTPVPTTLPPTTPVPTTLPPTTQAPTTPQPTTPAPTTPVPTTPAPTTPVPTTQAPTTPVPTTLPPTTQVPTTPAPTTPAPTTLPPTTLPPTTAGPTTAGPTTIPPTTLPPTTLVPTTLGPTTEPPEPVVRRRGIKDFGFSFRDRWR